MGAQKQMKNIERESPGATGEGEFYHIEILPKQEFKTFRTQDVGKKGGIERVGGQRENGSWDTVKWLVSKKMAHIENGTLVADHPDAQELFDELKSVPKQIKGDIFKAKHGD